LELTVPAGPIGPKYEYFRDAEDYPEAVWIATMGTGKSTCLADSIILDALNYPGCHIGLFRAKMVDLQNTTAQKLVERAEYQGLGKMVRGNDWHFDFNEINGKKSVVHLFGLDNVRFKEKMKSFEMFRAYVDECNEILEDTWRFLLMRLRAKVKHRLTGVEGRVLMKGVANDEGNNWVWQRFIGEPHPAPEDMTLEWAHKHVGESFVPNGDAIYREPHLVNEQNGYWARLPDGRTLRVRETVLGGDWKARYSLSAGGEKIRLAGTEFGKKRFALYATSDENFSLNTQNLSNFFLAGKDLEDQYRYGRVNIKRGKVFPEFRRVVNVVEQREIPPDWTVIIGLDHGLSHPTAAVFIAEDYAGNLYAFEEYEEEGRTLAENAMELRGRIPVKTRQFWYADPAMRQRDPQTGRSYAQEYHNAGVPLRMADNRREFGIDALRELLRPRTLRLGDTPEPQLRVMAGCERLVERLENFTWQEFYGKRNDDLIDALRYAAASRRTPRDSFEEFEPKRESRVPAFGSVNYGRL